MTQKALLQGAGDGTAVQAGYVGEIRRAQINASPNTANYVNAANITLNPGVWLINLKMVGGTANASAIAGGFSTDSNAATFSDIASGENFGYGMARTFGLDDAYFIITRFIVVSSTTTYYAKAKVNGTASGNHLGEFEAIRIA